MTATQAPPAQAALPAPPAARTPRPHHPAAGPTAGRRGTHLRSARSAALLAGGAAAALLAMAAAPAMASTTRGRDTASTVSITSILSDHNIVTGVRGTTDGNVILTGSAAGNGSETAPFLYQGPLTSAADGVQPTLLKPPFPGEDSATFYGPDTNSFNPDTIPAGQVRAVGSYQLSDSTDGVLNRGMIYLGPATGQGGSWTPIDVPPDGTNTVDGVQACPSSPPGCIVADTIPHSTMGDLVVGDYDLNPGHGASGNAFIYNMTTQQWTLLQLGGSLASGTTLYGIWQDGGPGSPNYTLAGGSLAHGSSPHGNMRAFLMNYNEQTGAFGTPRFYNYGNTTQQFTHFDGITAVPGGFTLATISSAEASSMAFIPATRGNQPSFGRATWYPIPVGKSNLCPGPDGCTAVTANTVYDNQVMGLYLTGSDARTYLATISTSATTAGHRTPVR